MSLAGNLRTMALSEILQWIGQGRKTGTLHLDRRSVQKRIAFQDGTVFSSWSNDPRESLGHFLVSLRLVGEEQLFKALLAQEKEGRLVGSILVADGTLSEGDLERALREKAEETIYDLFLWPEGRFEFKDEELLEGVRFKLHLSIPAVVLEGIRRVDEWAEIRKAFPSLRTTFRLKGADSPLTAETAEERDALRLAALGKSLAEIAFEMHRTDFDTAALLFDLHSRGRLAVEAHGEEFRTEDAVGAIEGLLAQGAARLGEKRYDEARKAYEDTLVIDRLNQSAKMGLIAVSEAKGRERVIRRVKLDKVPVLLRELVSLTKEKFDPQEGFVLSRVNGQWDVKSILKLCPMAEEDAILIFARLLERQVIELRDP